MVETNVPFKLEDDDISGNMLLGKYRTVRKLASGGMGVVYLARAEGAAGFVRPVVTKLILPGLASSKEFLGMFIREAHILANLREPGIVNVVDFAEERGCYVMVLDYVRGYELRDWLRFLMIRDRKLPTPVALQLMINVLDTLAQVHKATDPNGKPLNIVHRDISPSNILIDTDGRTKILDFGIGLISKGDGTDFKTEVSTFKGKLAYAAPEMFDGAPASAITDVYASAVTLHEILVGKNEFVTAQHAQTLNRVLHHQPSLVHAIRDDVPRELDDVIQKALQKKPEDRFQNAAQFAAALRSTHWTDERVAQETLSELVLQDFTDDLPHVLRCQTLQELDDAWLNPSDEIMATSVASEPSIPPGSDSTSRRAMSTAAKLFAGLAIVAVLASLALVVYLVINEGARNDKKVYIVPSSPTQASTPPTKKAPQTTAPQAETASKEPSKAPEVEPLPKPVRQKVAKTPVKPRPKKAKPQTLSNAFRRKTGAINKCVQKNLGDLPKNISLSVRFHLSATGRVKKALIVPETLSSTSLGRCIEKVASSTSFPAQENDVTIRIPLNVSID